MTMPRFRPICPVCRRGGYDQTTAPDGRPLFRCGRCGKEWTSGTTGTPYARPVRTNDQVSALGSEENATSPVT